PTDCRTTQLVKGHPLSPRFPIHVSNSKSIRLMIGFGTPRHLARLWINGRLSEAKAPMYGFVVRIALRQHVPLRTVLRIHSTASRTRRVATGLRPGRPSGMFSSGK